MAPHDPGGALLIRSAHVVTGDGREIHDADVLVRDGRIHTVTEERLTAQDATVVEGEGKTVVPGLVDAHVHLDFLSVRGPFRSWLQTRRTLPRALGRLARNGVTTIRCMADPLTPVTRLRRKVEQGRITSPSIVTAGPALTAVGGHPDVTLAKDNRWLRRQIARTVDDAADARAAVRDLHRKGADLIKVVYQGGPYGPDRVLLHQLSREIVRAIVDEARHRNLPVSAHTHYQDDVADLLELGIDSIEHGVIEHEIQGDDALRAWAHAGSWLVPTLTIAAVFPNPDGTLYIDTARRNLTRAYQAGVRIAAGTDSMIGAMPASSLHDELRLMVEAGMSEAAAIQAATADAAELLRQPDRGVVEPGRRADLVLLRSDPLAQIENLADIDLVVQDGTIIYRAPAPPRAPALATYTCPSPPVLEYLDRTRGAVPHEALLRYDRSRFIQEGIRTLTYHDPRTGQTLRSETVRSGPDLVTREWRCEIPAEQTTLHAVAQGHTITLTGVLGGEPVSRSHPLRGRTWLQLLLYDPATFITSDEAQLTLVAIGASGRGALQLTDFELTKKVTTTGPGGRTVEAELVMPQWRRFWGARILFDAHTGDPVRQQVRGRKNQTIERTGGTR